MKKLISLILVLALTLSAAGICAESAQSVFADLAGLEWSFCSGAGAWSTNMRLSADGSFSGEYHDSEMGDTGEAYPYGTIYGCSFSGKMSFAGQTEDGRSLLRIDWLELDEGQVKEAVEDGLRFVTTEPYGLSEGDVMVLYAPGTPLSDLTEDMLIWTLFLYAESRPEVLESWFLYSEKEESGFMSWTAQGDLPAANPWEELTKEQLTARSGLSFGIPDGAQDILYRYLPSEELAEMQFSIGSCEFTARIRPAALQEGQLMNIADMYFAWENERDVSVGHCPGRIGQAQTGSAEWVMLCQWYDIVPGIMYSLSVHADAPDAEALLSAAEQVFIPVQGND